MPVLLYRAYKKNLRDADTKAWPSRSYGNGWQKANTSAYLTEVLMKSTEDIEDYVVSNYNTDDYRWQLLSQEGEILWQTASR